MGSHDNYYNNYMINSHVGAYNTQFSASKQHPNYESVNPAAQYEHGYDWMSNSNDVNIQSHDMFAYGNGPQTYMPENEWALQDVSGGMTNMNTAIDWSHVFPATDGYPVPTRYTQSPPYGSEMMLQTTESSLPVDISPSYTGQYVDSWGTALSVTPPNEFHSSGSDEGSDDTHSNLVHINDFHQQTAQRIAPITPPRSAVEERAPPVPLKTSYYRSRIIKGTKNPEAIKSGLATSSPIPVPARPVATGPLMVQKKRKACSSCKRRKVSCAVPAGSHKCNQCLRTGDECDSLSQ
ncbi:hypothetical protein CPB86DRAFT_786377 [Serendipita vermifera]|nr:hypothetical protein CPB86DRAFT_786377 [Serendipita vermifera]